MNNDLIERQAAIDAVVFECGRWTGLAKEISKQIRQLPSVQPEVQTNANGDWIILNKDKILKAGMEGREVDFRIGGRLFTIREKAQ